MSDLFKELTSQIIETGTWSGYENGTLWAIRFQAESDMAKMKSAIERKRVSEMIAEAESAERAILDYLKISAWKKDNRGFSLDFLLNEDSIRTQGDFYEKIAKLYLLRNPRENAEGVGAWIAEKRIFIVNFDFDGKSGKPFIRKLDLSAPIKKTK